MGIKTDFEENIKYTDSNGVTSYFSIGDNVICCVGAKQHTGKIIQIGYFNDDNEESEKALYIDTSTSKTSYSGEIIKLADITYIAKNPLSDITKADLTQEEIEKNTYTSMLIGMGYEKEKVEDVYKAAHKLMKQFNISVEKMMACTVYALNNNCSITEPLKTVYGIDIEAINLKALEEAQTEFGKELVKAFLKTIAETIKEYTSKL